MLETISKISKISLFFNAKKLNRDYPHIFCCAKQFDRKLHIPILRNKPTGKMAAPSTPDRRPTGSLVCPPAPLRLPPPSSVQKTIIDTITRFFKNCMAVIKTTNQDDVFISCGDKDGTLEIVESFINAEIYVPLDDIPDQDEINMVQIANHVKYLMDVQQELLFFGPIAPLVKLYYSEEINMLVVSIHIDQNC